MTHTAEQQKSIKAIETTDITASKCVNKGERSREAYFFYFSAKLSVPMSVQEKQGTVHSWGLKSFK